MIPGNMIVVGPGQHGQGEWMNSGTPELTGPGVVVPPGIYIVCASSPRHPNNLGEVFHDVLLLGEQLFHVRTRRFNQVMK